VARDDKSLRKQDYGFELKKRMKRKNNKNKSDLAFMQA
jgi:hypothetical protein